jgi:hypothetical protein
MHTVAMLYGGMHTVAMLCEDLGFRLAPTHLCALEIHFRSSVQLLTVSPLYAHYTAFHADYFVLNAYYIGLYTHSFICTTPHFCVYYIALYVHYISLFARALLRPGERAGGPVGLGPEGVSAAQAHLCV